MKHKNSILFIGSFALLGSAEYTVPAQIDERGNWFVNVSIPSFNRESRVSLTLSRDHYIPSRSREELIRLRRYDPFHLVIHDTAELRLSLRTDGTSTLPVFSFTSRPLQNVDPVSDLSVGVRSDSPMVQEAGSIALIRSPREGHENEGHLVIESTFSSFNSTCVPGSVMRRYFQSSGRVLYTDARLKIGDYSENVHDMTLWNVPSAIAGLDYGFFQVIVRYLVRFGARRTAEASSFTNCTREVIDLVPPFELSESNFGTVKIFADEYIELLPGGICRIVPDVSPSGCQSNHFGLNLLKLQNLNIRISSNGIVEFCDAKYDDPLTSGIDSSLPTVASTSPVET